MQQFWLKVGDRVHHVKDVNAIGTVSHIDLNMTGDNSITTCLVRWDDCERLDILWTNKLARIDDC